MIHYNIGKKVEINPFDGVKVVTLSNYSLSKERLQPFLDSKSESVETRKIAGSWVIAYSIEHLDFITLINWLAPLRGKFQFKGHWIHFTLENDVMACW